jgi:predicted  nucleic acid-binding Zn-ribbon protein
MKCTLAISIIQPYNRNMNQALQLFNLQKIDSNLDNTRARLKEIEITLNDDSLLIKTQEEVVNAEKIHQTARKDLKITEDEVRAQQTKIDNNQKTLYSGSVKNPKELEDLQNESEALKRYLLVLEDKQLEKMMACEGAEIEYKTAQSKLEQVKKQVAEENIELTKEKKALLEGAEKLENEREHTVSTIGHGNLSIYSKLRETHRGVAVVEVSDRTCSACGATLSASMAQAVHSPNKVTFCDSCGRILYAK